MRKLGIPALALFCSLILGPATAQEPAAATDLAWSALWANRLLEAEQTFQQVLDENDDDQDARRGLILTYLLRGRDQELADALEDYADDAPHSPYDTYLLLLVNSLSGRADKKFMKALRDLTRSLTEADDLRVVDRRQYWDLRASVGYSASNLDDVRKATEALGRVTRWALLGPFDNTSGSGEDKDHIGPDGWQATDRTFTGKSGQEIRWFSPRQIAVDGTCAVTNYLHEDQETTAFARTVLEIPEAGSYLVAINYKGTCRFLVNDRVLHEGRRRQEAGEVAHWRLDLPAGPNRFAFRISSRDEESMICLGITHPDGSLVKGLLPSHSPGPSAAPETAPSAEALPCPFQEEIVRRAAGPDDSLITTEARFWLIRQTVRTAEVDSVSALCERLAPLYPESGPFQFAIALACEEIEEHDRSVQAVEKMGELTPDLAPGAVALARIEMRKERYAAARAFLAPVLEAAPDCRNALEMTMDILLAEHDLEQVAKMAGRISRRLPDDSLGPLYLAHHAGALGRDEEARKYRARGAKKISRTAEALNKLFACMEREDHEGILKHLDVLLENAPDAVSIRKQYVQTLLATGRMQQAIQVLEEALESFPQDPELHYLVAVLAEDGIWNDGSGQPAAGQAAAAIRRALNSQRDNLMLREKLRTLLGQPSFRTILPEVEQEAILARRVDPADHPDYADARAVVLQEWNRNVIFDDGANLRDFCLAVQILTQAGASRWEQYTLPEPVWRVNFLERKTIKADGTEHQAETALDEVHFSNLAPGDVILLHYQSTTYMSGQLAGHFWDRHVFPYRDPCLESRYVLLAPPDREVRYVLHDPDGRPESEVFREENLGDGYVRREWSFRDLPPSPFEGDAIHHHGYLPWVEISTVPDWATIAAWYEDLAAGQAEVTLAVRDQAAELTAGCADEQEKIARILDFVSREITYAQVLFHMSAHIPREAEEVLKDRFGDCKDKVCLMIALLEAAGIPGGRFALVSHFAHRSTDYLPSPHFNHVVLCLGNPAGEQTWNDPTMDYPIPGQMPGSLRGAPALVANRGTRELIPIRAAGSGDEPTLTTYRATVRTDGSALIEDCTVHTGIDDTSSLRQGIASIPWKDLETMMLRGLTEDFPGAVLDTLSIEGLEPPSAPVTIRTRYDVPRLFTRTGSFLVGKLAWGLRIPQAIDKTVASPERETPLDLRKFYFWEVEETRMVLPDGMTVVELPADGESSWGECFSRTEYALENGVLVARCEVRVHGEQVEPENYPGFKAFLEGIVAEMGGNLLLQGGEH